jgi:hypothetical protein
MAYSHIVSASAKQTTGAINTTGADLIVLALAYDSASTASDSKGNTWTFVGSYNTGAGQIIALYYCQNPTVGSGHTFSGSLSYGAVAVSAFSGSTSSPYDVKNGTAMGSSGTSVATGSITPSQDNELCVAAIALGGSSASASINGSFTIGTSLNATSGVNYGVGLAYLVQTTAASANPTWSWTNAATNVAMIASFKSPASAARSGFFLFF